MPPPVCDNVQWLLRTNVQVTHVPDQYLEQHRIPSEQRGNATAWPR